MNISVKASPEATLRNLKSKTELNAEESKILMLHSKSGVSNYIYSTLGRSEYVQDVVMKYAREELAIFLEDKMDLGPIYIEIQRGFKRFRNWIRENYDIPSH